MPFVNPVTSWGEIEFATVLHKLNVLQFSGVTPFAAATNTQYSTPGAMVQETVALLSPGTTFTSAGAGAGSPLLPHPDRDRAAIIARKNAESCFISVPLIALITRSRKILCPASIRCQRFRQSTFRNRDQAVVFTLDDIVPLEIV